MICHDQTAYIKDRYIGESIRLVQDIIEYVDREEDEAILFSTDIKKAFDSVNHNFIFATLEKFGLVLSSFSGLNASKKWSELCNL